MKNLLIYLSTRQVWNLKVEYLSYVQFMNALSDRKSIYTFVLDDKDVVISLDKVVSIKITDIEEWSIYNHVILSVVIFYAKKVKNFIKTLALLCDITYNNICKGKQNDLWRN